MGEIFKNTSLQFGGAFAANRGLISSFGGRLTGVLMQSLQLSYSQAVTRIFEIGQSGQVGNIYYIGGRASGNMSVAHIMGPKLLMKPFYEAFSDICEAGNNNVQVQLDKAACGPGGGTRRLTYVAKFCVLIQIGMNVGAQDLLINEGSSLMFSNLDFTEA